MQQTTALQIMLAATMLSTVVTSVPMSNIPLMKHTLPMSESPFSMVRSNLTEPRNSDLVMVHLFTESLCPFCHRYILEQVFPAVPELASIMDLVFVNFGNAEFNKTEGGNYEIECQHESRECLGNIWENCAEVLAGMGVVQRWLPFTKCFMEKLRDDDKTDIHQLGKECAKKAKFFNPKLLEKCATGLQGFLIHIEAGLYTTTLSTRLPGVPTLYIDFKKAPESSLDDFARTVCEAYHGKNVPKLCEKYKIK